ncbi:MAG: hypothetical protein V1703_02925 [Candidatus Altiarchaeota archaeon]
MIKTKTLMPVEGKMKPSALAISAIIITVLLTTEALAECMVNDAESFYRSALTYWSQNDFKNGLRNAYRARDVFESCNNQDGISRCNQLITEIETTLTEAQIAHAYYGIASEYYLQDPPTTYSYKKAKDFAQRAKDFYDKAEDSVGSLTSEALMKDASRMINEIIGKKQQDAYTYYKMSQASFFDEEYTKARTYAINASRIYNEILDSNGISQTASLIVSIDSKINETRYNALASYDRGWNSYLSNDYDTALKYASISQQLYTKINDIDGISKATALISRINTDSDAFTNQKLVMAQNYYDKGEEMLILQNYVNATDYAKGARDIYLEFYNIALEKERSLPTGEQVNMKRYGALVQKVDSLINRINSEWGSKKKKQQAEEFYTKAQEYYIQNQLDYALNYAQRAKDYFTDLNDYLGVNKCDALVSSINNRMSQKRQADEYYNTAYGFYKTAEFENAMLYNEKSKTIYTKILDTANVGKSDNLTSMIRDGIRTRDEASGYYQEANNYFNLGDYEKAKASGEQAYFMFIQINYTLGIVNSQQILNQSNTKIQAAYESLRNTVLVALVVIVVGIYLLASRLREQKTYTKEIVKEKEKFEEQKAMMEKEWDLRKEEETKDKVEDELRKLIDQERGQGLEEKKPETKKTKPKDEKPSVEDELRKLIDQEREHGEGGSQEEPK